MTRAPGAAEGDGAFARSVALVTAFAALAAAARIGLDMAIAWRWGTGPVADAYGFVVAFVQWPAVVALSVLTLLVAPAEATLPPGPAARTRFRAELLGAVCLAAVLLWLPAQLALEALAGSPASGLSAGTAALARAGVPAIAAAMPIGIVAGLLAAWLVAGARHELTLVEALPALVVTAALLVLPGVVLFGATTAGAMAQLLALAFVLHRARALPWPRLAFTSPAWRDFAARAPALVGGQMAFTLIPLVDPLLAAHLGAGVVAAMGFANRLLAGLQGLAGLALQRAGLPLLTGLAMRDPAAASRAAHRWAWRAAAFGTAVAAVVTVLADPLVGLLFQRGRFGAADSAQVALLLRIGVWQLPPFMAGLTLVTALAAVRATGRLAVVATIGLLVKVLASAALLPWLGAAALPLAGALMYTATTTLCALALAHRVREKP